MYYSKYCRIVVWLLVCVLFSLGQSLFAQNESNEHASFASGTLNLPILTIDSGSSTPSYINLQLRLNSVDVIAATAVSETITDEMVMGALAYSKYWVSDSGGDGVEPDHSDFTRCKACHGWDLLATAGGYVRRSDGNGTRSGAVNIRLDRTDYTSSQILNDGGWVPSTDTPTESHPDYTGILSQTQVDALVAYLNSRNAKFHNIGTVYNAPNPAQYTVPFGDTTRGSSFYSSNCQGCHGAPDEDSADFFAGAPSGGISAFVAKDGKFSEFAHKALWGEAGSSMTRSSIGSPTTQDIADMITYLKSLQ
jgi:cytochrome c2